MGLTLREKASALQQRDVFLGGPIDIFHEAGQKVLTILLSEGMTPASKLLEIGCGCLRCGYWLISILEEDNYFGIEPNTHMLQAGQEIMLSENTFKFKKPRFDNNDQFDLNVFDEKFDFFYSSINLGAHLKISDKKNAGRVYQCL